MPAVDILVGCQFRLALYGLEYINLKENKFWIMQVAWLQGILHFIDDSMQYGLDDISKWGCQLERPPY